MERLDTTLRPFVFFPEGLTARKITADKAKAVGATGFKKYEYILYSLAQLSRIVYCDTGIGRLVIEKSLGLSPDVVNQVITDYDYNYKQKRRNPIQLSVGGESLPVMETYVLESHKNDSLPKWGTYVSTVEDFTAIVMDTTKFQPNDFATWKPTDVIVSVKGSSTLQNFKHDLLSQFTPIGMETQFAAFGFKSDKTNVIVPGSFLNPLLNAWTLLKKALAEHVKGEGVRLFVTGHSLGGAYASLLTFILALAKADKTRAADLAFLDKISIIHNVTYGAPTILGDGARNVFNEFLKSGTVTLDRVVSQKIASRSAAAGAAIQAGSTIMSPNDIIPLIPAGFSHPGYRPLATNIKPEAGGRPYSMEFVRKFFGIPTESRWRTVETWPFKEPLNMDKVAIQAAAKQLTGLSNAPASEEQNAQNELKTGLADAKVSEASQEGGGILNTLTRVVKGNAKSQYSTNTQGMLPNFLSVEPATIGLVFAHAEYLGMTFWGAFRLYGMKNPATKYPCYFGLYSDGVKGGMLMPGGEVVVANTTATTPLTPAPAVGGSRRLRRRESKSKKTAKRRNRRLRKH